MTRYVPADAADLGVLAIRTRPESSRPQLSTFRGFAAALLALGLGCGVARAEEPRVEHLVVQYETAATEAEPLTTTTIHFVREDEGYRLEYAFVRFGVERAQNVRSGHLTPDEATELQAAAEAWREERGFVFDREPRTDGKIMISGFWDDREAAATLPLSDLRRARAFVDPETASPACRRLHALALRALERAQAKLRERLAAAPRRQVIGTVSRSGRVLELGALVEPQPEPSYGWRLVREASADLLVEDGEGRRAFVPRTWLVAALHEGQALESGQALALRPDRAFLLAAPSSYHLSRPLAPGDPSPDGWPVPSRLADRLVRLTGRATRTAQHDYLMDVERVELLDPETFEVEAEAPTGKGLVEHLQGELGR